MLEPANPALGYISIALLIDGVTSIQLATGPWPSRRPMPIRTRRWNDPTGTGDGSRVLVCRYRPRGLRKDRETWDEWRKPLAPSVALHADAYGKRGRAPLAWPVFRRRYLAEMRAPDAAAAIDALARRVAGGETITLLCSSACTDESRCHRSLLRALIAKRVGATGARGAI